MKTKNGESCGTENGTPQVSQSDATWHGSLHVEATTDRYASFLQKARKPAADDWSNGDLAEMLLQELNYHPDGPTGKELSLKHHKVMQRYAKRALNDKNRSVQLSFAYGIYFVSIVRAWLEHREWISELKRDGVEKGLRWVQDRPWVKSHPALAARLLQMERSLGESRPPD